LALFLSDSWGYAALLFVLCRQETSVNQFGKVKMERMSPSRLATATSKTQAGLLVVDDHDLVLLGLRALVQSHANVNHENVRIFEARTLQDALAQFELHQSHIDLVFLDLRLPDAQGLSGLVTFLTRFPGTRIVVLSGESDPTLAVKAVESGALTFLSKSADLSQLLAYFRPTDVATDALYTESAAPANPYLRYVKTIDGTHVELSARQSQAFDLLLSGHSNKQFQPPCQNPKPTPCCWPVWGW